MEAEMQAATDAMYVAWPRLKVDTWETQLRRAVRHACDWLSMKCNSRSFLERHVVELEKLRKEDQRRFFQNIKSLQLEGAKEVESQYIRDKEGRLHRDKGSGRNRWVQFFCSQLNGKSDILHPDIP